MSYRAIIYYAGLLYFLPEYGVVVELVFKYVGISYVQKLVVDVFRSLTPLYSYKL